MKLLIVDDDPVSLKMFEKLMEDSPHQVQSLSDSSQIFESLQSSVPDLIFLDIFMPQLNGIEILKILKEGEYSTIPIVAYSSKVLGTELETMFDHVVPKDADLSILLDLVESYEQAS